MPSFWSSLVSVFSTMGIVDYIDILIITFLIYQLIRLAQKTRAAQLMKGLIILAVVYILSSQLEFKTLNFVLDRLLQFGIIAIIVVFQPELRRGLERIGSRASGGFSLFRLLFDSKDRDAEENSEWVMSVNDIASAVDIMSQDRTGAIIAIERMTGLGEIITTGTTMDSRITPELIRTIFYEGSPLHDGAVIIRDARLFAAGCFLPLSSSNEITRDMGTRHRAALGLSENSDAIVIVVSEETGIISVAQNGIMVRKLDRQGLLRILRKELLSETDKKSLFGRVFKHDKQ